MTRKKLIGFLAVNAVALVALITAFLPFHVARLGAQEMRTIEEVEPRVVIVFGAGLKRDGTPSDALDDRLRVAAELYRQDKAIHILVSGDNRFERYNEPQAMHDALVGEYGVPTDTIAIDFAGRRTYDTCIRAKTLWDVDQAILVSQTFHLPRAIWTCQQLGIDSVGVSASLQTYVREEYYSFREVLALYKAFVDLHLWTPSYVKGNFERDWDS